MKRWMFNLFATISLLLCLATAALWVRSYWRADMICWVQEVSSEPKWTRQWSMRSLRGSLQFSKFNHHDSGVFFDCDTWWGDFWETGRMYRQEAADDIGQWENENELIPTPLWRRLGLRADDIIFVKRFTPGEGGWVYGAPCWLAMILSGFLPAIWLARRLWVRRRTTCGLCSACGYDLRASKDRCPECGKLIPKASGVSKP